MAKRKVFISYSRQNYIDENDNIIQDSSLLKIMRKLDEQGIDRWIDVEGKYAGHSFGPEIRSAIMECDLLIFISSKESNYSEWTPSELHWAKSNHKLIIPVLIDEPGFSEAIEWYIPGHIDKVEFYRNEQSGLEKIINNINKEFHRLDEIDREAREEEERKRKEKEEEERRIQEEAAERARIEAEREKERQRRATITKEINQIKTRIKGRIEKDIEDVPRLVSLERELDNSYDMDNLCPVCGVAKENKDFCENCGWFYRTAAERLIKQKKNHYPERLDYSRKIWKQKEEQDENQNKVRSLEGELDQKSQLVEKLMSECDALTKVTKTIEKELEKSKSDIAELEQCNDKLLKENKHYKEQLKNATSKNTSINLELKKANDDNQMKTQQLEAQVAELQNKLSKFEKKKNDVEVTEIHTEIPTKHIAYLLTEEYGQYGIYVLYEGTNTFGAIVKNDNTNDNYQMIVAACPELHPKHFSINIKKDDKKLAFVLEPYGIDCIVCLNNKNQKIEAPVNININDVIYIGEMKLQLIDNYNK